MVARKIVLVAVPVSRNCTGNNLRGLPLRDQPAVVVSCASSYDCFSARTRPATRDCRSCVPVAPARPRAGPTHGLSHVRRRRAAPLCRTSGVAAAADRAGHAAAGPPGAVGAPDVAAARGERFDRAAGLPVARKPGLPGGAPAERLLRAPAAAAERAPAAQGPSHDAGRLRQHQRPGVPDAGSGA